MIPAVPLRGGFGFSKKTAATFRHFTSDRFCYKILNQDIGPEHNIPELNAFPVRNDL